MTTRNTKHQLMFIKKNVLDRFSKGILSRKEASKLLNMHPNAISRLKKNYQIHGEAVLTGRKLGPKLHRPPKNRTAEHLEQLVVKAGLAHPELGPKPLANHLSETQDITLD